MPAEDNTSRDNRPLPNQISIIPSWCIGIVTDLGTQCDSLRQYTAHNSFYSQHGHLRHPHSPICERKHQIHIPVQHHDGDALLVQQVHLPNAETPLNQLSNKDKDAKNCSQRPMQQQRRAPVLHMQRQYLRWRYPPAIHRNQVAHCVVPHLESHMFRKVEIPLVQ